MRALLLFILIGLHSMAQAQSIPTNRQAANHYIGFLKDGALVVRLKTNDKSIRAYRNAGNTKLADKLEREASERNLQIMRAFTQRFCFARIYFIEAKNTQRLLRHERHLFLNGSLQIDTSIALHSDSFLLCDYSTLMQNEAMNNYSGDARRDRESGTPTSNMAMVILDTSGAQLADPFPYSALVVDLLKSKGSKLSKYNLSDTTLAKELLESPELDQLDKYELAVRSLNNRLIRFYNNLQEKQGGRDIQEKEWWEKNNPNTSWRNTELLRIEQRLQSLEKNEAQVYSSQLSEQEQLFQANIQAKLAGEVAANRLILCQHTPVYTLGKSGELKNLLVEPVTVGAEFYKTNRGGDITFHGPGQLVAYPILDLDSLGIGLAKYIFNLEEVVIQTLQAYHLHGERISDAAGVWLRSNSSLPEKICAIGVKASRGITMHGLAMNVNTDLSFFNHIVPCGLEGKGVTSLQRELNTLQSMDEYTQLFCAKFEEVFQVKLI